MDENTEMDENKMSLEDLPVLRAGTTLKFKEYKDRRAEVRYQRERRARKDETIVHLVGYVPGIFPKKNYMDRNGEIFCMKHSDYQRRLLLIREVRIHNDGRGEDIWDDDLHVEIPLTQILDYREIK